MKSATFPGPGNQFLDDKIALGIFEVPPILANSYGLPGVDQIRSKEVIDEKIAVASIGQGIQNFFDLFLGGFVVGAGVFVNVIDGCSCERKVVEQFRFFRSEHPSLERCDFFLGEVPCLVCYEKRDRRYRQDQRYGREQKNLKPKIHSWNFPRIFIEINQGMR